MFPPSNVFILMLCRGMLRFKNAGCVYRNLMRIRLLQRPSLWTQFCAHGCTLWSRIFAVFQKNVNHLYPGWYWGSEGAKMKEELVYWEQNGKVLVEKVPFKVLQCILESGKKCYEWTGKQTDTGWWIFQLFTTPDGVYLVKDWEPAIGYSWVEVQIYKVFTDEE